MQKSPSGRERLEFYLDKSGVMYDSNLSLSSKERKSNPVIMSNKKENLSNKSFLFSSKDRKYNITQI